MTPTRSSALYASPIVLLGLVVLAVLVPVLWARMPAPLDLEWMEGGILAHAWRLQRGEPLYTVEADWAPFLYPPGYPALIAALPFELTFMLGRIVSLVGMAASAGAIAFAVRRQGGGRDLAFGAAVAFLGTYQATGAFLDLVRPDSLGLALLAWSIAIGLERHRGAPVAAGLLLAAAFVVKHNLAAFGLPMVLGLAVRRPRDAVAFALASAGPALALTALWQWQSDGMFLTFLIEVPRSHPTFWRQGLIAAPREWGNALPLSMGLSGLWLLGLAVYRQQAVPTWLAAGAPVWFGMATAWAATYEPPDPDSDLWNAAGGVAAWAVGAGLASVAIWWGGALVDRARGAAPSWKAVYGVGIGAVAVGICSLMRAHSGGFVNVNLPLLWAVALALGVGLARLRAASGRPAVQWAVSFALALELAWGLTSLHPGAIRPTAEDLAAGKRVVTLLAREQGPVLSPMAAWLPVYAGHPPSVHAMAIWDLDHEGGPLQDELSRLDQGLRDQRWGAVLVGDRFFRKALEDAYDPGVVVLEADNEAMWPKTGWRARPTRIRHARGPTE